MGLGEKVKKLFLKLGFNCLPWVGYGAATAYVIANSMQGMDTEPVDYLHNVLPTTGALAGVLLLTALGTKIERKRRAVIEPHKGIDKILDYPAASATTFTGIVGAANILPIIKPVMWVYGMAPVELSLYYAFYGAAIWSVSYSVFDVFSMLKSPCIRNFARILGNLVLSKGNPDKLDARCMDLLASESETSLASKAKIIAETGRLLDAVYYWNASLQFRKRRKGYEEALAINPFSGMAKQVTAAIGLADTYFKLRKNPHDCQLLVRQQFIRLLKNQPEKVKKLADKVISSLECTDEMRILQSFILDSLGEAESAERLRKEAFPRLFQENQRARVGKSLLYQKLGFRERLVKESQTLDYLQKFCSNYDFEAARPLGVWDFGRASCLFETFSDGTSLYDFLEENPDISVMRKAAMAQAALHAILPCDNNYELERDVSSFMEKLPQHISKQKLYDALIELLKPAARYQAADCDGHRENRHYNLAQQITVYDAESRGSSPITYDYAKLRGQGCSVGTLSQQKDVLAESAGAYNRIVQPERRIPESEFCSNVLRASPYKAMRFALFVQDKPERHHSARQFLANAELDLLVLSDVLKKESRYVISDALRNINDLLVT